MTTDNPPPDRPGDIPPGQQPADVDAREADGPVVDAQQTKQGRSGLRIVVVLVVSIALILIVYAIILMASQPGLDAAEDERQALPVPEELQPVPEASPAGSPAVTDSEAGAMTSDSSPPPVTQ